MPRIASKRSRAAMGLGALMGDPESLRTLAKVAHPRFGPLEVRGLHQCSKDPARAGARMGIPTYGGSLPKAEQSKIQLAVRYSSSHAWCPCQTTLELRAWHGAALATDLSF